MAENKVTTCPFTGKPLKLNFLGDGTVGKDSLIDAHTKGIFPEYSYPSPFDSTRHEETVDGITYCLDIWVSGGQEEYDTLRRLSYPDTSLFIVCFSLQSHSSFENIACKWLPDLRANCPKIPVLLVGTKKDIRDESVISPKDGYRLCRKEGCVHYLECSAKTGEGLKEVFQVAAQVAVQSSPQLLR